jgi:two-component system OmpR family sensor kinase
VANLVVIGGAVLLAIVAVGWVTIRRELRPLETIAETAGSIAGGNLSHRAELPNDGTEIGRLGAAFDSMLDQIQTAFDEERAALRAKEESEGRLRQFVADASHELRTPLTALRGYAELYRAGGLADAAELDRAMARIGTESRRMGSLVEDLLLLARLDQGRPLARDRVDLSAIVDDAVGDARTLGPDWPLSARVPAGVRVVGDEDRLRQVVGNLLTNVRVHTPPGTATELTLEAAAGRCRLTVADHGPGIGDDHADRIFDRFFRADPGRSRDRGGSGLGLAIVASIVAAHGGSIGHAPTPGGGATFQVELPALAD